MEASVTQVEEFLAGPLVSWLATCVKRPESLQVYESFFDGAPISEVLLQIDPEPPQVVPSPDNLQGLNVTVARIKIFHTIIRNIKAIYEDELGQVVISLPDCVTLGRSPGSEGFLEHLKLLILMLLGCAVQGPTKERFITKIKALPLDIQHEIVECIKLITDDQSIVLTLDWSEQRAQKLYSHVQSLTRERDKIFQQWVVDLAQETVIGNSSQNANVELMESNHLAVELADWKARFRKQRQELEEKTEIVTEYKEELEHMNALVSKLKSENGDLLVESRRAKAYRDEVDAMREKVERVERLESEIQRYRERLADTEFYKTRVEELREDNRVLLETREMLESQLVRARQRSDHVLELEAQLLASKQNFNDVLLEKDSLQEKVHDLMEEIIQLQQVAKSALQETSMNSMVLHECSSLDDSNDNSLCEQLSNNAQARALKLELENQKLQLCIEQLKEKNLRENASGLLDLQKEHKKLLLKCDQMQENYERTCKQNTELESLFKSTMQENLKLQETIDAGKTISDHYLVDLQNERAKIMDLEQNCDTLSKEKQKIQLLCDAVSKRADDADVSVKQLQEQLNDYQQQFDQNREFRERNNSLLDKLAGVEKENVNLQKDIVKYKELLEEKAVRVDSLTDSNKRHERELQKALKELESLSTQLEKLHDLEQKSQELQSQASVQKETIAALKKDLIAEKVCTEKMRKFLDKLGLNPDFDADLQSALQQMLNNANVSKLLAKHFHSNDNVNVNLIENVVDNELLNSNKCNEDLRNENAKFQVDIAAFKSHIHTLQAQHTALQLANSQLVAEKEEMSKQQEMQNTQYDALLFDQMTLRTIHEQLSGEYEKLKNEQESYKSTNRDLRTELRNLKEFSANQKEIVAKLETEIGALKNDSKNLVNLRAEHSKLKDDFRNLYAASERLKSECRNMQDDLKNVRTESRTLILGQTEMQGELNSAADLAAALQVENAKLQQRCDMLYEMNHSLDADRRALMDHVSQLLSQYHSLLSHSLEDKQHYHVEEKLYTDKLNNLSRLKEKLEEKIMEHYRKLDNASAKKRSFGATLVQKVRKASSDIINKVPSKNRRSWHEDSSRVGTPSHFRLVGEGSGESGGNDSDDSNTLDVANKNDRFQRVGSLQRESLRRSHRSGQKSPRDSSESTLLLGSIGSRRTVYLSEDEPAAPSMAKNANPAPMLVYNRISTVIGGGGEKLATPTTTKPSDDSSMTQRKTEENAKETAVWYEYGCV